MPAIKANACLGEIYIGRVTSLILSIYLLLEGKDW